MTEKRAPETISEVLQALHEFLVGPEPDLKDKPIEEVRSYLTKQRLDSNAVLHSVQKELRRAGGELEIKEAHRRRVHALDRLSGLATSSSSGTRDKLLALIRERVGQQEAAVYARKLRQVEEEDLQSLLEDLERLDSLEQTGDDEEE